MPETGPRLSIAAVARETGLSKDVLRKWEGRYGFPAPLRDAQGERLYPPEQVERLRTIKRLMDLGLRPSSLVGADAETLALLARSRRLSGRDPTGPTLEATALGLLRNQEPEGLRRTLHRLLLRQGLAAFVQDTVDPLNRAVGEAWARGELQVYQEHLYTEAVQWVLRNAVAGLSEPQGRPRVLLTTLPEEPHGLGVLMVAALLALEGAYCLSLGPQTPAEEIANAALAQSVDVVALSFSVIYPPRRIPPALEELQQRLGPDIEVWAGGTGTRRLGRTPYGVRLLATMDEALAALGEWRAKGRRDG